MARSKVVQYDYYQFLQISRRAEAGGKRITPSDRNSWEQYVLSHGINEGMATAIARLQLDSVTPVIIDEGRDTDGLYFYSPTEEGCLRLVALETP
jgi:hypothetical protein